MAEKLRNQQERQAPSGAASHLVLAEVDSVLLYDSDVVCNYETYQTFFDR